MKSSLHHQGVLFEDEARYRLEEAFCELQASAVAALVELFDAALVTALPTLSYGARGRYKYALLNPDKVKNFRWGALPCLETTEMLRVRKLAGLIAEARSLTDTPPNRRLLRTYLPRL